MCRSTPTFHPPIINPTSLSLSAHSDLSRLGRIPRPSTPIFLQCWHFKQLARLSNDGVSSLIFCQTVNRAFGLRLGQYTLDQETSLLLHKRHTVLLISRFVYIGVLYVLWTSCGLPVPIPTNHYHMTDYDSTIWVWLDPLWVRCVALVQCTPFCGRFRLHLNTWWRKKMAHAATLTHIFFVLPSASLNLVHTSLSPFLLFALSSSLALSLSLYSLNAPTDSRLTLA